MFWSSCLEMCPEHLTEKFDFSQFIVLSMGQKKLSPVPDRSYLQNLFLTDN